MLLRSFLLSCQDPLDNLIFLGKFQPQQRLLQDQYYVLQFVQDIRKLVSSDVHPDEKSKQQGMGQLLGLQQLELTLDYV